MKRTTDNRPLADPAAYVRMVAQRGNLSTIGAALAKAAR